MSFVFFYVVVVVVSSSVFSRWVFEMVSSCFGSISSGFRRCFEVFSHRLEILQGGERDHLVDAVRGQGEMPGALVDLSNSKAIRVEAAQLASRSRAGSRKSPSSQWEDSYLTGKKPWLASSPS